MPPNKPSKTPKQQQPKSTSLCLGLPAASLFCSSMGSPPQSPVSGSLCGHISLWKKPSTQLHTSRENKRITGRLKDRKSTVLSKTQATKGVTPFLLLKARYCKFQIFMQSRAEQMKLIWSHPKNQTPCSLSTHASGWRSLPILQNWY